MKICFVASSGGHWDELMTLEPFIKRENCIYATEDGGQARNSKLRPVYTFKQINRKEKAFILHFFAVLYKTIRILKKEKPDVIITTGALIAFPFCLFQRLRKGRVIYIESFARVSSLSLTGKLCYPLSDLFLVQWKELKKKYPRAIYTGGVF